MVSFRKSKRSSGATCSGSSKRRAGSRLLQAGLLAGLFAAEALAESGVIAVSGGGKDSADAIAGLLRATVSKYFQAEPPQLSRALLAAEILPSASSFVQSYRVTETGRSGGVSLSASVDLDVIQGLFNLTPKNLGQPEGAKFLLLARAPKLPEPVLATLKAGAAPRDCFTGLAQAARERFLRREFTEEAPAAQELQAIGPAEDLGNPELLRAVAARAGARIALALTGRFESYENENSHNKEERLVLSAVMLDVKSGQVIGRSSAHVPSPRSRKEQYISELERGILEESRDLLHDAFVAAGRRLVKAEAGAEFTLVRVQFPSNGNLLAQFRALLEKLPGVRSVVEHQARRGHFDLALRPPLTESALRKAVSALQPPDLSIQVQENPAPSGEEAAPALVVQLAPKGAGALPDAKP